MLTHENEVQFFDKWRLIKVKGDLLLATMVVELVINHHAWWKWWLEVVKKFGAEDEKETVS